MKPYTVSEVPSNIVTANGKDKIYYCHARITPNIPVFGSIGDKKTANKVCKMMNASCGR